ncbi:MAG: uracil-DNA glycosylase [Isosphaeraceae bacterium]|nr:uracil-DNA glycosylase [Isosphaeraceae bacterium]
MSTEHEELHRLVRETRQRLEALARAGYDRMRLPAHARPIRLGSASAQSRPESTVASAAPPVDRDVVEAPTESAPPPRRPAPRPSPAKPASAVPATTGSFLEAPGFDTPPLPLEQRVAELEKLRAQVAACTQCPILSAHRTQTVFGVGPANARLMFIGEGPGADEDRLGEPFVGRAGALLTDMITKGMGLSREDVYIANIVKSRPPENRTPTIDEIKNCLPFLERQIEIIRPEFLCLLGKTAVVGLLETALPMNRLRGRWHRPRGIPAIVTWHPAYLLRNPAAKRETWEDLQMLMNAMGLKTPERRKS